MAKPESNQRTKEENDAEKRARAAEVMRQHPTVRKIANAALLVALTIAGPKNGIPLKELRKLRKEPGYSAGLLEGAVLSPDLFYPDLEEGVLLRQQAGAGGWVSYDFNRAREFPKAAKASNFTMLDSGALTVLQLPEIEASGPDDKTPTDLPHVLRIDHILSYTKPSLEEATEKGFVRPSTYAAAYAAAGLYDDFAADLDRLRIHDEQLQTVTPKGNAVTYLFSDGGKPTPPGPEHDPVFEEAVAHGARLA